MGKISPCFFVSLGYNGNMANGKNGRRKQRGGGRRREERTSWYQGLRVETRQSVWAVVAFAAALLLLLAWLGKAGLVGESAYYVFTLLFGRGFFIVPLTFAFMGTSFLLRMHERMLTGTVFGAFLFLLSALGLADIVVGERTGGYAGFFISFLPLRFFDFSASLLIFAALLMISLLVTFNIALTPRKKSAEELMENERAAHEPKFASAPSEAGGEQKTLLQEVGSAVSSVMGKNGELAGERDLSFTRVASRDYKAPPLALLEHDTGKPSSGDIRANANIIQRTLENFGIDVDMGEINVGPTVTQYTLKPAEGVKLSRITNLSSNLGLALAAHPLRIEAPIPGRALVGIEVPNRSIAHVGLRSILTEYAALKQPSSLGFGLGRDVTGQAVFTDLAKMPHLLIAGSTGSGKSVAIHSLLLGLLYTNAPEALRLILIDPKRVELAYYNNVPHLMTPVIVEAKKAIQALRWAVKEMERRYEALAAASARDIISYNTGTEHDTIMPYLVIIIDELADLMASFPREVEASVVRLAQMARAVGIHLVVSTQRPSVEVITGLIKANITTRIAFQVASQIDSRTILDMAGAEKLLGRGDMLYLAGDAAKPRRIQGVFVSEQEVKRATEYMKKMESGEAYEEGIFVQREGEVASAQAAEDDIDDDLYQDAHALVVETGKASASFFQRRLRVGYARAARLIDLLESRGVVGPGEGAKPREVLVEHGGPEREVLKREEA